MKTGRAMRAFTGICTPGMISQMLQIEDEREQRQQEGRELQPVRPDRLHDDAVLDEADGGLGDVLGARWAPGPACGRRGRSARTTIAADSHIRMTTLFTANGPSPNRVGHSTTWEMGGNSNPKITRRRPPWSVVGLRPGKASEADT